MPKIIFKHYDELVAAIRTMQSHHKLYKVLRDELKAKGHWKQRVRGRHAPKAKLRV